MIRSFRCHHTETLFTTGKSKPFATFKKVAERKLQMLDSAATLESLRVPPGNRLELLGGDRKGQHSMRINDQWRLCFVWTEQGPEQVEIANYH